jgi:anti-sigma-K factor RskA
MTTDDPRDLIGAYVLDACSPEEEAQVRAHMKVSAEFRAEVESFAEVRRALLEVPAPDVAPDPALKRSIMAQVQAEASLFQAAGGEHGAERAQAPEARPAPAAQAPTPPATGASPARGTGTPAPAPRRNAFMSALRSPARATALAAVIVALIVGGFVLGSGGSDTTYNGRPTFAAGADASVRLVAKEGDNRLKLSGFPKAGSDREYQVWLKTGDEAPRPTKVLFDVDEQGNAEATIPGDLDDVDDVLVTAEPDGGSPAPTTDPVLHVEI